MKNTIEKANKAAGKVGFQNIDFEKTKSGVDCSCGNENWALCREMKLYTYIMEVVTVLGNEPLHLKNTSVLY